MNGEANYLAAKLDAALDTLVRGDRASEEAAGWRLHALLVCMDEDGIGPSPTWTPRTRACVGRAR